MGSNSKCRLKGKVARVRFKLGVKEVLAKRKVEGKQASVESQRKERLKHPTGRGKQQQQ